MTRRLLLRVLATLAAAIPFRSLRLWAQEAAFSRAHADTLRVVVAIVLPESMGRPAMDEAVGAFMRWVRNYRAGADMDHGYGFTCLRRTPVSPLPAYQKQLDALEAAARARGGSFATRDRSTQRTLIAAALEVAKVERLPARPTGQHVISDLMGHFLFGHEANDLCYQAQIGRDTCRALSGSEHAPAPLK